jgi:prophage regulatory protein
MPRLSVANDSPLQLLRLPQVLALTGKCRSSLYADMAAGRFIRPIKISVRASAWPRREVEELIDALTGGVSPLQLTRLVSELQEARTRLGSRRDGHDEC